MVCDFCDRLVVDEDSRILRVTYGENSHTISIEVIPAAMGIQPGYTQDQNPKGSQALGDWFEEIILKGKLRDGYIKLNGFKKNQ